MAKVDRDSNSGVTLTELLVTMAIFLIVGTMLSVEFSSWITNTKIAQDRSEAMQQGRLAMAQLTKELRQAISPTASPSAFEDAGPFSITFRELTTTLAATSSPIRVTFSLTPQRTLTYFSRTANGVVIKGPVPIASYVSNPTTGPQTMPVFRYFTITRDSTFQELPSSVQKLPLTASERTQIAQIQITLIMDKDPSSSIGQTRFSDTVLVRSWGFAV
ncbi:MAG: hypothetical protein C4318_02900 [Acidimicrobiia bacterium]